MKMLVMRVVALLLIAVLVQSAGAAEGQKKEETSADLAKRKVELARKMYQHLADLEARRTITGVGFFYPWSRRWMEAQLEVSSKKADQIAAYQAHLDRMTRFAEKAKDLVKRGAAGEDTIVEPEYYRAEAALWLAKAKEK